MSDADYEFEDICVCGHSFHDHDKLKGAKAEGTNGWGVCFKMGCFCEMWRP